MAITTSEAGHMGGTEAQKLRREAGELAWAADALQIAKDARAEDPHILTKTRANLEKVQVQRLPCA
jgi:hypothetical protein